MIYLCWHKNRPHLTELHKKNYKLINMQNIKIFETVIFMGFYSGTQ